MDEDIIEKYAYLLYTNLAIASPKRTRNMARNITMKEYSDRWIITISNGVPYAWYVNYNWGTRKNKFGKVEINAYGKDGITKTRKNWKTQEEYNKTSLHKERENYKWVERTIEETMRSLQGRGVVNNEL